MFKFFITTVILLALYVGYGVKEEQTVLSYILVSLPLSWALLSLRVENDAVLAFRLRLLTVTFILFGLYSILNYGILVSGDGAALVKIIFDGGIYPRWLGTTTILSFIYKSCYLYTFLSPERFLYLVSALFFLAITYFLSRHKNIEQQIYALIFSPLCLLFLLGHLEIYPFLTCALILALVLVEGDPKSVSITRTSLVSALLAWLYLGFLPLSFSVVLSGMMCQSSTSRRILIPICTALLFIILVQYSWSGGIATYFSDLASQVPMGTEAIGKRYAGLVTSESGALFSLNAAFSKRHLSDYFFMTLVGGGPLLAILLLWAIPKFFVRSDINPHVKVFYLTGIGVGIVYSFLMIPRLGPRSDIDLFFWVYLLAWSLVGKIVQLSYPDTKSQINWYSILVGLHFPLAIVMWLKALNPP